MTMNQILPECLCNTKNVFFSFFIIWSFRCRFYWSFYLHVSKEPKKNYEPLKKNKISSQKLQKPKMNQDLSFGICWYIEKYFLQLTNSS